MHVLLVIQRWSSLVVKRTSGPRSPGRSLNLNRSYAFAHTSASGSTSYVAAATRRGLVGCRRELSCSVVRAAPNEFSMEASCASRDISTASFWKFVLQEMCHFFLGKNHNRALREEWTNMSVDVGRSAGVVLSRDMYSVLRSHETFAGIGGVPGP